MMNAKLNQNLPACLITIDIKRKMRSRYIVRWRNQKRISFDLFLQYLKVEGICRETKSINNKHIIMKYLVQHI